MSSIKRKITHFHIVVVLKRERNVQKSVMLVRSCCFAYSTFCFFDVLVVFRRRWILKKKVPIECSHSRGQHLCKFIGTKESVSIRKEFNSHRTGLGHQHGRRFIVLGHQYGRLGVLRKHPQLKHQRPVFGLAHYKMNITFTFVLMTKKKHRSYFKGCLKNSFLFCGNEVQNCLDRC